MIRLLNVAFAALLLLVLFPAAALAADGYSVTVPWGSLLIEFIVAFGGVIVAAILAIYHLVLKHLPAPIRTFLEQRNADQLLERMINYGLNSAAGAAKGKTLNMEVGSRVMQAALGYGFGQAPKRLAKYFDQGHPGVAVAKAIYARLDMDAGADEPDFEAIVADTAAAIAAR
ncbi:hypothetical protein SAMN05216548_1319 [Faunimonas pinastri]|uniref:Uncharacterized protein n=1 Tax=Faunimonas pinastri TaxID=1855383 RepID=A0A1H9QNI1_9HYPH|nr:hypothetical protein [Faunimonas pinastri]SER61970.1 hypothetical protein SAMN05216548_1319 [Faunimonas pinastri]